jgi:hypothetical protein
MLPRVALLFALGSAALIPSRAFAVKRDPKVEAATSKALEYLAREQRRQGYWEANGGQYRVAMTALAGTAMLCEGSTTTRGKYAPNIARAVDFLLDQAQPNGLIGYPDDFHYTYGHGFSMMFLSQVFGEEEDVERRERLKTVLEKAVKFSAWAQTTRGGWGYVSAKDGNDFDEGSTCVTQVQGLRACRNSGIVVPKEIIDRAKQYIHDCMDKDTGGVQYSIRGGGARPPITAAAIAAMYSAGEYDQSDDVKRMMDFCEKNVWPGGGLNQAQHFGHWHYTHFYYAQVMYRRKEWDRYFSEISQELLRTQSANGAWQEGHVGPVYVTAINGVILQLDKGYLPIFQR